MNMNNNNYNNINNNNNYSNSNNNNTPLKERDNNTFESNSTKGLMSNNKHLQY